MNGRPRAVEFLDVRRLRLVEGDPPRISPAHRATMDRAWEEAVRTVPALFDGPVVACAGMERDGRRGMTLYWTVVPYRHYALHRVPGAAALPSLFVAVVQPVREGGLLVGLTSASTAVPGRWQVPGGSVEPPAEGVTLDEAALRGNAARELAEETGVDVVPEELVLWAVTRGEHGNIGVFFRAVPRSAAVLRERFAASVAAETAAGVIPAEGTRCACSGCAACNDGRSN